MTWRTLRRWSWRAGTFVFGLIVTGLLASFGQAPGVFAGLALTALALVLFEWRVRRSSKERSSETAVKTGAEWEAPPAATNVAASKAASCPPNDLQILHEEMSKVAGSVQELRRSLSSTEERLLAELGRMAATAQRLSGQASYSRATSHPEDQRAWSEPPPASATPVMAQATSAHGPRLPHGLVAAWDHYLREGDGRFEARGLDRSLQAQGVAAHAVPGEDLGVGAGYLGVVASPGADTVFLLPSFKLPAHALANWFSSPGHGSRQALICRLVRPATARRADGRLNLVEMGEVE